ncbi:FadR family transcriptional regulator [Pseudaminobacter sp. 19-2017]|uniref:FadR family transcriptional regulator n=1 Tax=Pseudaminobacter soli (ex Zhang et al. 2022) TaxID=2831468 RepID=A0A942E0U1_9HYPH|nr:FCD domain-containing protein [Pseudaminobacter soli]MBS3651759.1 FadR family transcriptional regulator [Pseudaminobacter soli]
MGITLDLNNLKAGLSKRTIREQVSQRIAAMVQSGLLREGDELPSERELAATLEVSRETVRGAIQMLAAIGMVEISQGSRTRVIGTIGFPSADRAMGEAGTRRSAHQVYEARRLVELPTVRLAVERIDDAGIQRMKRLVDAQREMTNDPVRFQISDAEFHDVIYRAGGNPLLAEFLHEMYSFGLEFRRRVLVAKGAVSLSVQDHIQILDGFERRDAAAAVDAMENHLNRIHRTTLEVMHA